MLAAEEQRDGVRKCRFARFAGIRFAEQHRASNVRPSLLVRQSTLLSVLCGVRPDASKKLRVR